MLDDYKRIRSDVSKFCAATKIINVHYVIFSIVLSGDSTWAIGYTDVPL